MARILVICLVLLLGGCVTKNKCVSIQMLDKESSMSVDTPGTSWFAITLGSLDLEGRNTYQSCPVGEDPKWMQHTPSPAIEASN